MRRFLLVLLFSLPGWAREPVTVGKVAPGMNRAEVIQRLGKPASRTDYDAHAYIVFSTQPLFPAEQSWLYQGPDGESLLLFRGDHLRLIRAQTLEWRGQVYRGENWPKVEAEVKASYPEHGPDFAATPIVRGFFYSNFDAREQAERLDRFQRVVDKHHLDARGDIYRAKPGQVCQTCRALGRPR